ncbi:MAG: Na/Pi symporter [Candidatus Omnitrophica bacterium]|nr:Na/Pi symporter [Candidatus Omnitrophota bacterium]
MSRRFSRLREMILILFFVYLFLLSIELIGKGASLLGRQVAQRLLETTSNPFVGLFIGVLVTSLVQSSSLTTSLVVALVGGGILNLPTAIPIVMGANIGTTITNTMVSMAHIKWRRDFRRAFAAATVHDFFNILTVIIIFPLELKFHFLTNIARSFERLFENAGGFRFTSPVKSAIEPALHSIKYLFREILHWGKHICGMLMIGIGLVVLFISLVSIVRMLKSLLIGKVEVWIDKYIFRNNLLSMSLGLFITTVVQSSSLTTSVMVPLVATGILSLEKAFIYTMGANVGTTFTALMASFAVSGHMRATAVAVALAHLSFNLIGIAIFYPVRRIRRIPINLARRLSFVSSRYRYVPFLYVGSVFIILPLLIIIFDKAVGR